MGLRVGTYGGGENGPLIRSKVSIVNTTALTGVHDPNRQWSNWTHRSLVADKTRPVTSSGVNSVSTDRGNAKPATRFLFRVRRDLVSGVTLTGFPPNGNPARRAKGASHVGAEINTGMAAWFGYPCWVYDPPVLKNSLLRLAPLRVDRPGGKNSKQLTCRRVI
ncbi:MAG: hypothetical protein CM15mP120_08500 [Pseudomonadota bacterium]|nr:MAG: hypothetical protein CM15mP120_08500 [Pseudomonadota bacterium]